MAELNFQGWRRPRGSQARWEKVDGATGSTPGDCYGRLMDLSELTAGIGEWEYQIAPVGEQPGRQEYRHRMLRPGS